MLAIYVYAGCILTLSHTRDPRAKRAARPGRPPARLESESHASRHDGELLRGGALARSPSRWRTTAKSDSPRNAALYRITALQRLFAERTICTSRRSIANARRPHHRQVDAAPACDACTQSSCPARRYRQPRAATIAAIVPQPRSMTRLRQLREASRAVPAAHRRPGRDAIFPKPPDNFVKRTG